MISRTRKAFTLLELIVVIVVLGILSGLSVPAFTAVKARATSEVADRNAEAVARETAALAAFDA